MCKIKTLSGKSLRDEFTAFEVEALKYAVDNNLAVGINFPFKTEESGFNVVENNEVTISLLRVSNNKTLTACKVAGDAPSPRPVAPRPAAARPAAAPTAAPAPAGGDAVQNAVNALLQAVEAQKAAAAAPAIDAAEVAKIVAAEVAKVRKDIEAAHTTKININGVDVPRLEGKTLHPAFEDILTAVSDGDIPFLVGPAGTGKTTAAKQVAEALNLPFYCVGALQSKYEMEGYRDATGNFCDTVLYKAMINGGVFLFDEIDATTAEVLVPFNSIMANGYYTFPNGEKVEAHKDFRIICAGNTVGRGADESYCGRYQLDASTLDRFGFIEVGYCEKFDMEAANNDKNLVALFVSVREALKRQNLTYTATPRALLRISKKVLHGWEDVKALRYGLCGGWAAEDIKMLQSNVCGSGRWFDAFKKL